MFVRLFIATIVIAILWAAIAHYKKQSPANRKKLTLQYAIIGVSAVVILLAAFGRLHWVGALIAGIAATATRFLPLLARFAPFIAQMVQQKNASKTSSGNTSTVQSAYLKIHLDHDSGVMTGEIIAGQYAGKTLAELSKDQVKELLLFYQTNDQESLQLLFAFAQRQYPDESWDHQESQSQTNHPSAMNKKEALEILGLDDGADETEVKQAHKKLMQRLHPDRGGSPYLAAKVNQAKDFLLK